MMTDRDLEWLALYVSPAAQADKVRADIQARWDERFALLRKPVEGWSFYDREVNRNQSDFDRENYGL
jgi:hypothetical protein